MTEVFALIPPSTLLNLVALLVYVLVVRQITVFSFVLVGVMVIEVLHQGISFYLQSFYGDPSVVEIVFASWYLGYAATDFLFYGLTMHLARTYRFPLDPISNVVMKAFLIMGVMQIVRYVERLITDSDLMGAIYSNSIVLINMIISIMLLGYVAVIFFKNFMPKNKAG